ncbi:hypothetical protein GCM10008101_27840 [Lysobacter xinjiangensis]|uniref:Uncharacterized protein n=1 Tax=Cognatilysobacter xinjiangensis TaxID=546892 RepID=A0ABQ3C8M0_9GAMM|nr:hypothetical protein [Lysobacter xinjiangensis]GGZ72039.1 hypothetical protein GCM10008101_27840 [Lysobacter xinjiangensis]
MSTTAIKTRSDSQIDALVADAQADSTAAQQLALDASKLAGLATERLETFRDAGFFKRCWYKLNGRTESIARATTADLVEMQALAWQYLAALQKQNLIEARSIAIIRNNLAELAETQFETRELLLSLTTRVGHKIGRLEQVTSVIDWRTSLKVQGYDRLPPVMQVLSVVYDYSALLRENDLAMERIVESKDLEAAFEMLGIDGWQEFTLSGFAERLLDETMAAGMPALEGIVEIRAGERVLAADQVLEMVSGSGFNCVYEVASCLPMISRVARHAREEDRRTLMLGSVRDHLSSPDARYCLLDLAREIAAGISLVRSLCETDAPVAPGQAPATLPQEPQPFSLEDLLSRHVPLQAHPITELLVDANSRQLYIDALILAMASPGEDSQRRGYLSSLSRLLQCEPADASIERVLRDPRRVQIDRVLDELSARERQYAWLVDATFLGCEAGGLTARARGVILQMARAFNLKNDDAERFVDAATVLATETVPAKLIEALARIATHTGAWRAIIDFRKLSFAGAFAKTSWALTQHSMGGVNLSLAISRLAMDVMGQMSFGDEGFFQRTAISAKRSLSVSSFNDLRKKVEAFEEGGRAHVNEANRVLRAFGQESHYVRASLYDCAADKDTAVSNENWCDNMDKALDKLRDYLDACVDVMHELSSRLDAMEAGRW